MKKLIYMGLVAFIATIGIFWSCQKDEFETNPGNGLMLKNGTIPDCNECIIEPVKIQTIVSKTSGPNTTNYGVLTVWNTPTDLIVTFAFDGAAGADGTSITIGSTVYSWVNGDPDAYSANISDIVLAGNGKIISYKVTHPLSTTDACTAYNVNFASNGGPGGILSATNEYLIYEYCEDCDEESFSYETEDNLNILFAYNYSEEAEVTIVFTMPQVANSELNIDGKYVGADGKIYEVNNATNQTNFTWTGPVSCKSDDPTTFVFSHSADCGPSTAKDGKADIWTDAKIVAINGEPIITVQDNPETTEINEEVIGYSVKGTLDNIVYSGCPIKE